MPASAESSLAAAAEPVAEHLAAGKAAVQDMNEPEDSGLRSGVFIQARVERALEMSTKLRTRAEKSLPLVKTGMAAWDRTTGWIARPLARLSQPVIKGVDERLASAAERLHPHAQRLAEYGDAKKGELGELRERVVGSEWFRKVDEIVAPRRRAEEVQKFCRAAADAFQQQRDRVAVPPTFSEFVGSLRARLPEWQGDLLAPARTFYASAVERAGQVGSQVRDAEGRQKLMDGVRQTVAGAWDTNYTNARDLYSRSLQYLDERRAAAANAIPPSTKELVEGFRVRVGDAWRDDLAGPMAELFDKARQVSTERLGQLREAIHKSPVAKAVPQRFNFFGGDKGEPEDEQARAHLNAIPDAGGLFDDKEKEGQPDGRVRRLVQAVSRLPVRVLDLVLPPTKEEQEGEDGGEKQQQSLSALPATAWRRAAKRSAGVWGAVRRVSTQRVKPLVKVDVAETAEVHVRRAVALLSSLFNRVLGRKQVEEEEEKEDEDETSLLSLSGAKDAAAAAVVAAEEEKAEEVDDVSKGDVLDSVRAKASEAVENAREVVDDAEEEAGSLFEGIADEMEEGVQAAKEAQQEVIEDTDTEGEGVDTAEDDEEEEEEDDE